jgi:hypothetical protein
MFKKPYDPLQAYLVQRAKQAKREQLNAKLDIAETRIQWLLHWFDRHYSLLHKVWIYSIALALSCYWINTNYGWVNLVIIPVQTAFLGALVAVVELPTMLVLAALWALLSVSSARLWQCVRRLLPELKK